MPATGLTSPPLRELARRISSGTDVTLYVYAAAQRLFRADAPLSSRV